MTSHDRGRWRGWLRWRGLHFAALGALLFALRAVMAPELEAVPSPVVVSAEQIETLRRDFERRVGVAPTPAQEAALIDDAVDEALLLRRARDLGLDRYDRSIRFWLVNKLRFLETEGETPADDEALYQEALALGLDRGDPVIRGMLSHKMRALASQPPPAAALEESELRDYLERHRERYRRPAQLWLTQVFLRGPEAEPRAGAMLERLHREETRPEAEPELGDPFALGRTWKGKTEAQLAKLVGSAAARRAFECAPAAWCGPVRSPYGLHLLWLDRREDSRDATFDEVRSQVVEGRRAEIREERLQAFLSELRTRYTVVVERPSNA